MLLLGEVVMASSAVKLSIVVGATNLLLSASLHSKLV